MPKALARILLVDDHPIIGLGVKTLPKGSNGSEREPGRHAEALFHTGA